MNEKTKTGRVAEQLAKKFLIKKGYIFVTENYRSRWGEIDLIFKDKNDFFYFFEIKYRENPNFGIRSFNLSWKKRQKIIKTACVFCQKNGISQNSIIIKAALVWKNNGYKISLFSF